MNNLFLSYSVLKDKKLREKIIFNLLKEFEYNKLFVNFLKKADLKLISDLVHSINKTKIIGPMFIDPKTINVNAYDLGLRERKFNDFKSGKRERYFREDDFKNLENIDFSKLPPIVLCKDRTLVDGCHRTYLAKKFNKKIKAFILVEKNDNSKYIDEILNMTYEHTKSMIKKHNLSSTAYIPT